MRRTGATWAVTGRAPARRATGGELPDRWSPPSWLAVLGSTSVSATATVTGATSLGATSLLVVIGRLVSVGSNYEPRGWLLPIFSSPGQHTGALVLFFLVAWLPYAVTLIGLARLPEERRPALDPGLTAAAAAVAWNVLLIVSLTSCLLGAGRVSAAAVP